MTNAMKAMIHAGRPALACSLMFPSSQLVEMLGCAGFDWVLLDCEHRSLSLSDVEVMAMAGVQIPHIDTADDARRAVASAKLRAGDGYRGLAAGTRPDRWGLGAKMPDFIEAANERSLVCVQLESARAIANEVEIVTVPDIDVFFIGPSGSSQSMGFPGNANAAPVAAAIADTLGLIRGGWAGAGDAGNVGEFGGGFGWGVPVCLHASASGTRGWGAGVS